MTENYWSLQVRVDKIIQFWQILSKKLIWVMSMSVTNNDNQSTFKLYFVSPYDSAAKSNIYVKSADISNPWK